MMEFILKLTLVVTFLPLFQSLKIPDYRQREEDFVALLAKRIDAIEAKNEALIDENADMKARIQALETLTADQQKEIERLTAMSGEQTTPDQQQEQLEDNREPDTNNQKLSKFSQHKGARSINRIKKANNEATVAFFTTLNNHIENPGVHQPVVFENVITNIGNAYNQHAGDFRAPVNGVYVFSATLMAGTSSTPYHFQIMHNGSGVSRIYIPTGGTASQEAVLYLNAGDDVVIHNLDAGHRVYGHQYTSFSGFLLQEDFTAVTTPGILGK